MKKGDIMMLENKQIKSHLKKHLRRALETITEQDRNLNLMKLMFIYFEGNKLMPEMLTFSYYQADEIKSRFAVMSSVMNSLVEFGNLKSAIRFIELLADNSCFYTHEFYDNFRIVEISGEEDNLEILSIVVNLVDYFDVLCAIKDGKFSKNMFNNEEFNEYYEHFINIL